MKCLASLPVHARRSAPVSSRAATCAGVSTARNGYAATAAPAAAAASGVSVAGVSVRVDDDDHLPGVCPRRSAPRDGAVAALQLEEDRNDGLGVVVVVQNGCAMMQELRERRGQ